VSLMWQRFPILQAVVRAPFLQLPTQHQTTFQQIQDNQATTSKFSFPLIYCLVCFRRQLTCVNLCNCFLFLETRGRVRVFQGLIVPLPLYAHVKEEGGVRPVRCFSFCWTVGLLLP
jgi:hypothetical protein